MPVNRKRLFWVSFFVLLFLGGIAGGFVYFSHSPVRAPAGKPMPQTEKAAEDSSFVRIYYPSEGRLVMEERGVKRQASSVFTAEEIVREFLKGPSGGSKSDIPAGAKLLRIYSGSDGILYVDLSDDFRRNFQGDALSEFLLLKGLYDSVISNITGIDDVKILIEGREIESIGGHLLARYPLKTTLSEIR